MFRIINLDTFQTEYLPAGDPPSLEGKGNCAVDTFLDIQLLDTSKLFTNDVIKFKSGPYQNLFFVTKINKDKKIILENTSDKEHQLDLNSCYLGDLERVSSYYKWKKTC